MHRLVIALTTLLGLTAATYLAGHLFLFSAPVDPAADLAPADTVLYVAVTLQPPSGQGSAIAQLASRLPGFADASALDEKVDQLAQTLLAEVGLDYRTDVRPWLGDEVVALMAPGADGRVTLLVSVRDQPAAEEALARVEQKRGEAVASTTRAGIEIRAGLKMAYAFVDGTLVVGADAMAVEAVVDVSAGAESLGDRAQFVEAMAGLPAERLAAIYLDLPGLLGAESRYPYAAAALIAEPGGLALRGASGMASDAGEATGSTVSRPATLPEWMPADTQVAVSLFDSGELLGSAEDLLSVIPATQGFVEPIQTARTALAFGLGLDLDDVLDELLRGEAGLVLRDLDTDAPSGALLLAPEDIAATTALLAEVTGGLEGLGASVDRGESGGYELVSVALQGIALSYAVADPVVVIGLDVASVEHVLAAQLTGENLASVPAYSAAFETAGTRSGNEAFVDPEALLDLLGMADGLPGDARDILTQLSAIAVTLPDRGDHLEIHAVLTVD